jgi:hypothetical protein
MSMIRAVTYKASIQQDGSIYNESVEMSSEIDSMPLSPDQLAVAMDRVTEMRSAILSRRKAWEGATAPEVPKEQPKPAGQSTIDGSKPSANTGPVVKCIKCGAAVEPKRSQKGVEYSYCPNCKDNRRKDGTEFPPKGA